MRRYNFIRPIILIVMAILVKSVVTNLCLLFGLTASTADNLGILAMVVTGLVFYSRVVKNRNK